MGLGHHTKDKGDLAVLHVAACLGDAGAVVCVPMTEHAPFDLVAYLDGAFVRVQVKYRRAVDGVVTVRLRSTWSDSNGLHVAPVDLDGLDVVAVYEPSLGKCFWLAAEECHSTVTLRLEPARNGQRSGIRLAADYLELGRALAPTG